MHSNQQRILYHPLVQAFVLAERETAEYRFREYHTCSLKESTINKASPRALQQPLELNTKMSGTQGAAIFRKNAWGDYVFFFGYVFLV